MNEETEPTLDKSQIRTPYTWIEVIRKRLDAAASVVGNPRAWRGEMKIAAAFCQEALKSMDDFGVVSTETGDAITLD